MWAANCFQNTSNLFFKTSIGYQSTQKSSTKFQPCATILSLKLTHFICLNFWLFTVHPGNFALSQTQKPSAFLSQKQKLLENELFLSQARNNGTLCRMMSFIHHPYFLLREHWKLIFSNLHMSKHTHLPQVCVRVRVCLRVCLRVCVRVRAYIFVCVYIF